MRITHLKKLKKIKRHLYHPLIHHIHKEHKISKKTLFYIKEYGPHSNVPKTIIKESIKILLMASIISSIGGIALEHIKPLFLSIVPMIILFPALNDMIGDLGSVISSRFATMLHEGSLKTSWYKDKEIKKMFVQVFLVSLIAILLCITIAITASIFSGYIPTKLIITKLLLINLLNVFLILTVISVTSIIMGIRIFNKGEDPNNFLIPITTSIADFCNMIFLSILIVLFF